MARDVGLISDKDILSKARKVNKIRNEYVHIDINKIINSFDSNLSDNPFAAVIQKLEAARKAEPDCIEEYKNLMEILEYLYSEKRFNHWKTLSNQLRSKDRRLVTEVGHGSNQKTTSK